MTRSLALAFSVCLSLAPVAFADEAAKDLTYERDVRPIFKANCFHCHGEEGPPEAGLDLRLRRLIVAGGDSGPAIVPEKGEESLLLERIRSGEMPPGKKKLSAEEIDVIAKWIDAGAKTAQPEPEQIGNEPLFTAEEIGFWSFQPIVRPAVPSVQHQELVRTPIDAFILQKLEDRQLSFSEEADRRTLIRRASFDLTGLPPTPEEIAEFVNDSRPDAYERLIDRLLESPHYGERWGRHWLDVAGYADSEGYSEADTVRDSAWRYRDYVIRSLNGNKPWDQFIIEQLAGDELVPPPYKNLTPEQQDLLAATGFLRMAPDGTGDRTVDQDVARNQVVADTVDIVSTAFLGLTVACAQCHSHRYDPITHEDYHRMRALFEPAYDWKKWRVPAARKISLYTDEDRAVAQRINAEAAKVDQERLAKAQEYIDRTLEEELELVAEELREPLRTAFKTAVKERTPEQVELLKKYPSVQNISVGSLYLYDRRRDEKARKIDLERKKKEEVFVKETAARELEKVPEEQRESVKIALATAAAQRTPEQKALLKEYPGVLVTAATLKQFNPEAAAELQKDLDAAAHLRATKAQDNLKRYEERAAAIRATIPKEGFLRALTEVPGHAPVTYLFFRGDHQQPKDPIPPGELSVINHHVPVEIPVDDPNLPTTGRRLAYARHLTSGKHPLTARVLVNRFWLHHFGRGIVNSPGDFGYLGERPTHPELLDWLASEFMETGWDLKRLHKLIMTSTVYRQTSRRRDDLDNVDPDNHLYARMSIRRMEAEVLRDAMLAVGGTITSKLYGEPVPVMEDEVGQIVLGKENLDGERKPIKGESLGSEEFRRSIYVQVRRTRVLGMLETFDSPPMDPNCEMRSYSTVTPQSLMFMNNQFVIESAGRFAERVLKETPAEPAAWISRAWELAFGREPSAADVAAAANYLEIQRTAVKEKDPKLDDAAVQQRALATLCQALLSANAFSYID